MRARVPFVVSAGIVALLAVAAVAVDAHAEPAAIHELVIAGGRVIDPESGLDAIRNVAINDGRIAAISEKPLEGRRTLDARGLVVAPGFIDLHSHGQTRAADRMQAFDGVTTALELESGLLPIGAWYEAQARTGRVLNYGASAAWTFARIQELEGRPAEASLGWFQQAFALKKWVSQPATARQVAGITASLKQGIREGALGIGINAGYAPGGGYKELLAVHALAAKHGVPTFTHISGDYPDDPNSAAQAVGDIISRSTTTGSQDHICHLNSSSLRDIAVTREMVLAAQRRGLPISTEAYTYGAASTTIGAALFADDARRRKGVQVTDIEYNGKALDDASFAELRARSPGSIIVWRFLDIPAEQSILDQSVLMPGGAIASDAMPWLDIATGGLVDDDAWPLPQTAFAHPRGAGTFTRLLAQWVREREALTLSEAIRKSSLIPAQILEKSVPQMRGKGRLRVGADADVIVFDPALVADRATFTAPTLPAIGMRFVLVNGVAVIADGELVRDALPGKPVRRAISQ